MELNCFIKQIYIALKDFDVDEVHFDLGCVGSFNGVDKYSARIDDSSKQRIRFTINIVHKELSKYSKDKQFYHKRRSLVEKGNNGMD